MPTVQDKQLLTEGMWVEGIKAFSTIIINEYASFFLTHMSQIKLSH